MTFKQLQSSIVSQNVGLIAVSKTQPVEAILNLYNQGQRTFGENRVAELEEKVDQLPYDISWHFIGHLQGKKVKRIIDKVEMIHSVDSIALYNTICKEAIRRTTPIKILIQIKIAVEETKYGFDFEELTEALSGNKIESNPNVQICGVMGMASFTDDHDQVRAEFARLFQLFSHLKTQYFIDSEYFKEISMGMSSDYKLAIAEGSTMVRIGSLIFKA